MQNDCGKVCPLFSLQLIVWLLVRPSRSVIDTSVMHGATFVLSVDGHGAVGNQPKCSSRNPVLSLLHIPVFVHCRLTFPVIGCVVMRAGKKAKALSGSF